ncbi:MAG: ribonuclease III [Candidatus Pacebacteria bacterium]|nr:ribonuclease III [Candidatus Paceibacterota bacterium]
MRFSKMTNSLPQFNDPSLLERALTHRSALNEPGSGTSSNKSNERLEFLGDAVLELITTQFLFDKFPQEPEGVLTSYRSALVRTTTLGQVAQELNLGEKLYMSKGEEATGGRTNPSLLADTMEAVIGALYLDQGLSATQEFISDLIFPKIDQIQEQKLYKDPKSWLQELVQAEGYSTPRYRLVKAVGPDHQKIFTIEVMIDDQVWGTGQGSNKQAAQQEAAAEAIDRFQK